MPNRKKKDQEPSAEAAAEALVDETLVDELPQDEAASEPAEPELVEAADEETIMVPLGEWESLQRELGDLKQQILRERADFDNIRKRLRREAELNWQRKLAAFLRPLFTEMDNFEHALKAATPDRFQDFAMGVTMIHENILGVMRGTNIELVACEGIFDPAWHEVVQEVEDAELPRGSIVEVLRQGYRIDDQIIRAAQVVVSRPPAAAQATPESSHAASSDEASGADSEAPPPDDAPAG